MVEALKHWGAGKWLGRVRVDRRKGSEASLLLGDRRGGDVEAGLRVVPSTGRGKLGSGWCLNRVSQAL